MQEPYKNSNKIKTNWQDIKELIALENKLLRKIEDLERQIRDLYKIINGKIE